MIYFISDGEYVKIGFTDKDDVSFLMWIGQIGRCND